MSRSYQVSIEVSGVTSDLGTVQALQRVIDEETGLESDAWVDSVDIALAYVSAAGHYTLCSGATPDDKSEEWAQAIRKLGDYKVTISWWFDERDPDDQFVFGGDEED